MLRVTVAGVALGVVAALAVAVAGEEPQVAALERAFVAVSEKVSPAVVSIVTTREPGRREAGPRQELPLEEKLRRFFGERPGFGFRMRGIGSGVVIDPAGYILTNAHVIGESSDIHVLLSTNRRLPAKVLGKDKRYDLAVLKVESKAPLPFARFGNPTRVRKGQFAIALGNPFGLAKTPDPTMTVGHVSALNRSIPAPERGMEYDGLIQTDAAINPGNSGGPLVNIRGEVIGINTAIFTTTGGSIGIGFAVPINERTRALIESLKKAQQPVYGWIGIDKIQVMTPKLARHYKVAAGRGLLVARLGPNGPAAAGGVKVGDIILTVNGKPVNLPRALVDMVEAMAVGSKAGLRVWREGKEISLTVTVAEKKFARKTPRVSPRSWRGLHVKKLARKAADKLGLKTDRGVLVARVEPGSAAARAGLNPGQVIDRVRRTEVASVEGFRELVRAIDPAQDVLLRTNDGIVLVEGTRPRTF